MQSGSPRPSFRLDSFSSPLPPPAEDASNTASSSNSASFNNSIPSVATNPQSYPSSNMSNQQSASSDNPPSSYLRRRSAQQEAASLANTNAGSLPGQGLASRRPSAHSLFQSDFSLTLTSLSEDNAPPPPVLVRSTTPTISANSPLTSPFGKQRAADEVQAVANMVASNDIQRPASAPPRGPRSSHTSRELDDAGAEMMESAQSASSPPLQSSLTSTSIKNSALETMHLFTSNLSDRSLALLFFFIVMWGAVLSLDRLTTYSYQTIATNSFASHSSLAMVNVVRSVVAAVAAIPFAVVADLWGRYQAFTIALTLYAAGHIVMAASRDVPTYVGGVVLYEIGANSLVCLQNTVLADMTSARNRLFFQMVPQMPFLIFSFVSSDIYSAILPRWRWGIALFAILGPVSLFPVVCILHNSQLGIKCPATSSTTALRRVSIQQKSSSLSQLFACLQHLWILADLSGLILLAASLTLILVPLTLAAGTPHAWESPHIIAMIATGVVLGALFGYWESKVASNPLLARLLLRNRTFWGGAASLCLLWTAHALMIAYFPTYLYVVRNTSNRAQQNISVIYSFTIAASSLPVALVVRYSRRFKIFTVMGVLIFTAGLGMMTGLQGSSNSNFHLIASQIVIGLGGALTIALIQSAVQVSVPHAFVAQSIAALNVFPCMGNAIGAAIAGAIWGNLLPGSLLKHLASTGHQKDVATIYAEPLTWIESYPIGSSARTAVVDAYSSVWKVMMVVATVVCAISVLTTMCMKNLKLNDFLSVVEGSEKKGESHVDGAEVDKDWLFGDRLFEKVEHALWKSCARCGIKVSQPSSSSSADRQEKNGSAGVEGQAKRSWWHSRPVDCKSGAEKASTDVLDPSIASTSHLPAPILVVDRVKDDDEPVPHSAPLPSVVFRPPYSVQRSSPLARRVEGDPYL